LAGVHDISSSNFTVLLWPTVPVPEPANDVSGTFDDSMLCDTVSCTLSGGMVLESNGLLADQPWTVHDIRVFTQGTYTFDTYCTGADIAAGITDCGGGAPLTITVGPAQLGMHGLFDWGQDIDIDVATVWNFFETFPTTGDRQWNLSSMDGDQDGIPGIRMVEGQLAPFGANTNFNLDMSPPYEALGVIVAIDVPGGNIQLCTEPSGCIVTLVAETTLFGGAELGSVDWTINGVSDGSGETITPVLEIGSHAIEALATTTSGEFDVDIVNVRLFDTIPPSPLPDDTRLTIDPGSTFAYLSTAPVAIEEGNDGLVLGTAVPPVPGSFHDGPLDGNPGEQGGIVKSFEFIGQTATFWTESPILDLGGGLVDMGGWRGAWDSEPFFSFDDPVGLLTVVGDTYQLDYDGLTVAPPPFVGFPFVLHLEGIIILPNQAPDCSAGVASVEAIWPPNHRFVYVNVLGVTDPDGDPVSITIDSIFQDEPVDSYGDGRFTPDGAGVGTDTAQIRAERSGTRKVPGNGRVYHIGYTADDGQGGSCWGEVTVAVPHDRNTVPLDDGPLFDSTGFQIH
jgi:hypothetical protein